MFFGWGQINLQVRPLASWKQHRQMESCQHHFWEGTHILETKIKLSIVMHGAAVPWPSWNTEKVRDFAHSEKRIAEELKLDKGINSSWKEIWTGEKFYTSTIQLEWWRETIKSWHLFLTFVLRRQMKQYMLRYKKLTWDAVWYWRRVSTLANIHWIIEKAREFQKNICFCFIDYTKVFDCVDHNKLWEILKEMGIPDHLTCLLRNLYAGQEATVRARHGTMDWLQIGKGVCQGCILSFCLFKLYAEYIVWNAGLDEAQAEIKIAGRNSNNFRYADDTTLLGRKQRRTKEPLDESQRGEWKSCLKTQH